MRSGVEDLPSLHSFFTASGWARSLATLAAAAAGYRVATSPGIGAADPLVLALVSVALLNAGWLLASKWRRKSRPALAFVALATLLVAAWLLWRNDPHFTLRLISAACLLFALGHLVLLAFPGTGRDTETHARFLREQRGGLAVFLTALAANEVAIALGGGAAWLVLYAVRIVLLRAAIVLAAGR